MGMLAHYYQVNSNLTRKLLDENHLTDQNLYHVIHENKDVQNHLDIDKSWLNLVEVFKDIEDKNSGLNIGEITFYGVEVKKEYELDDLLNYSNLERVKQINRFLKSVDIENKNDFIRVFNSTKFTRYGEIDYSQYYDYLFLHFSNLKKFYIQCEKGKSGVIVSIG